MAEGEVVEACSTDGLEQLKTRYKDSGMIVFVSQKGCGGCDEVKGLLAEVVKDKLPVLETGLEDPACRTLAQELKVGVTPTLIYFKGGQEVKRIASDGKKTQDDMRRELRELVGPNVP